MGLFGDIFKPIGEIFDEGKKLIFGEPPKVSWTDPRRMIAPPSPEEKELQGLLQNMARQRLRQTQELSNFLSEYSPFTLNRLTSIARGELPDPFKRAIRRSFQEEFGGLLNGAAQRGILNSSVTQNAISDALQRALDMQVKYLPAATELSLTPVNFLLGLQRQQQELPLNLWNVMRSTRHGVQAQPIVTQGSGGLLGAIMPSFGTALGAWGINKFLG